jgi:hypothetical protein
MSAARASFCRGTRVWFGLRQPQRHADQPMPARCLHARGRSHRRAACDRRFHRRRGDTASTQPVSADQRWSRSPGLATACCRVSIVRHHSSGSHLPAYGPVRPERRRGARTGDPAGWAAYRQRVPSRRWLRDRRCRPLWQAGRRSPDSSHAESDAPSSGPALTRLRHIGATRLVRAHCPVMAGAVWVEQVPLPDPILILILDRN